MNNLVKYILINVALWGGIAAWAWMPDTRTSIMFNPETDGPIKYERHDVSARGQDFNMVVLPGEPADLHDVRSL